MSFKGGKIVKWRATRSRRDGVRKVVLGVSSSTSCSRDQFTLAVRLPVIRADLEAAPRLASKAL
jgi:hypothetical protein